MPRTLLLVAVFAAGCVLGGPHGQPCASDGDRVPAGVYGGVHYELTVHNEGSAVLLGDCSRATVGAVPLVAGEVHWVLTWQSGYGLPVQDTAEIQYIDVALDGSYCDGALMGTLTFPDGASGDLDVVAGRQADIYACL